MLSAAAPWLRAHRPGYGEEVLEAGLPLSPYPTAASTHPPASATRRTRSRSTSLRTLPMLSSENSLIITIRDGNLKAAILGRR